MQILDLFFNQNLPLDLFIHHYFKSHRALGSKDRPYIADAVYQVVRWYGLLKCWCGPNSSMQELVRTAMAQPIEKLQQKDGIASYDRVSFPEWLFSKLKEAYGEDMAIQICTLSNQRATQAIRTNRLKTTREQLKIALEEKLPVRFSSYCPEGLVILQRANYFQLPEYVRGEFEVQDEGSQLLASLVEPKPGEHVLDFCSGSGGKSLAIAPQMLGKGQLYLHDVRKRALLEAKMRCKRAGIQNVQFIEALDPKLKALKGKMDWVLVDAPCSGTGTLRRNPDMKWKLTSQEVVRLTELQRDIFKSALHYLKPTGRIVYATCSLLPEENQAQLEYFLKNFPLEQVGPVFQTFPTTDGPDGFFGVVMKFHNKVK